MPAAARPLLALRGLGALAAGLLLGAFLPPASGEQPKTGPVITSLTLFAGTPAGLWRSRDWGSSWQRVRGQTSGVPLDEMGAARDIQPIGPLVYLAGGEGVYISQDFGETWQEGGRTGSAFCLLGSRYPQADPTLFAGTAQGLLKSQDGGRTFAPTSLTGTPVYRMEWPGPALVLATGRGVLLSEDGGAHFRGPGTGLPGGEVRALALSSFFAADPVLFAAMGEAGVFRSADAGQSWVPVGLTGQGVSDLVWLGPFLYAAADTGLFRSEDAGATWTRMGGVGAGSPTRLLFPLAPAASQEAFLATNQGVFHTGDAGSQWQPAGLQGESVLSLATFPPPAPGGKIRK